MYSHAVVKVLLGGTHLDSHTEALVKKSIAKDVLQLFDLPEFHRIDNDARELATLLPAVRIVEQLWQNSFRILLEANLPLRENLRGSFVY